VPLGLFKGLSVRDLLQMSPRDIKYRLREELSGQR
jgi:hypothetical protein